MTSPQDEVGEQQRPGKGSGVAVKNIHGRIRLYYGLPYGLEFKSEPEEGTVVWVRMPAVPWEGGEET